MAPPAKENLPPKKRKENRPPPEVRNHQERGQALFILVIISGGSQLPQPLQPGNHRAALRGAAEVATSNVTGEQLWGQRGDGGDGGDSHLSISVSSFVDCKSCSPSCLLQQVIS